MKRNRKLSLTLTAALALTALTACGTLPASAATGRETATRIAADHLGCDASELRVTDFERDDGKYELEVIWNGVEYDDDWDDRYDDDWDDRYDDDWDDRYDWDD